MGIFKTKTLYSEAPDKYAPGFQRPGGSRGRAKSKQSFTKGHVPESPVPLTERTIWGYAEMA
jgi:hypothetical protein